MIGPSANDVLIDWYAGNLPYAVTPLEGIRIKVGPGVRVRYAADNNTNSAAANIAAESDVAIVFVGNNPTCNAPFGRGCPTSEGKEAVDRKTIELEQAQTQLVQRVARANPRTIVVVVSSFPYSMAAYSRALQPSSTWRTPARKKATRWPTCCSETTTRAGGSQ